MTRAETTIEDVLGLMRRNWPEMLPERAGFVIAVQRLTRLLQRSAAEALAPFALTLTEFELLSALRIQPPPYRLTPSDLYASMLMSSGGLTKVLKTLEIRGLVARQMDASDGRSRPVQLTTEGYDVINAAMAAVQAREAPVFEAMAAIWQGPQTATEALLRLSRAAEGALSAPAG